MEALLQTLVDTVPGDIEEAAFTARQPNLVGDPLGIAAIEQRTDVDDTDV